MALTSSEITEQRSYMIYKANELVLQAKIDLNIAELKILAFLFSKIKPTDTAIKEHTFSIQEYCQVCGLDYKNGANYKHIKKAIKDLRDKSFYVLNENGEDELIAWIEHPTINKERGKITMKLDSKLHKYVIGLFSNYTTYDLLSTLPMKSSYSFRLYEILKVYAYQSNHIFDIDDLKSLLTATHYANFKDFRRKVLDVATQEINLYTDIEVCWEPIKQGRKVIRVKFDIVQRESWGKHITGEIARLTLDGDVGEQMTIDDWLKELETQNQFKGTVGI